MVLGLPELSNVYSTIHDDSSCARTPQDAAVEAAKPRPSTTGLPAKDVVTFLSSRGPLCQLCGAIISDKGEITRISKAMQRRLVTAEITPHSNRTVEGTHRTGPSAGRDRRSLEIAGGSPSGSTGSPEQSDRSSMPSGRGDGRNGQDQKSDGSESGVSRSMNAGQKKCSLGGIRDTKKGGKDGMRPSMRRKDCRAQYSASISVR